MEPELYSIADFGQKYAIGRTSTYAEIGAGHLKTLKRGRRTFIARDDAEAWLAALRNNSVKGGDNV